MEAHAKKYSAGYQKDLKNGTQYTFWAKDFDGMAYKTMLRQLISKWGIMSIEMASALDADMAVVKEDGSMVYVETESDVIDVEPVEQPAPAAEPAKQEQPAQAQATNAQAALFS